MKLMLLFLTVIFARSCDKELNQEMKNARIEYQAVSRGYYLNISVADKHLTISKSRDESAKTYKLTTEDWKTLANLYKFVKVDELSTYKSPTEKRFYDGAAIATFRITSDGKTYETQGFDHGHPPKEIEEIVKKLVSFSTNE